MEPADGLKEGQAAEYHLVYLPRGETTAWWARPFISKKFAHVEVWWHLGEDFWVAIRPYHHYLVVDVMQGQPDGIVQKILAKRQHRFSMLPFGLKTCVSVAKAAIGVRNAFVLTPAQLYRYVEKRNGVV